MLHACTQGSPARYHLPCSSLTSGPIRVHAGFLVTPQHFFFMFLVFFLALTMFTYLGQCLVFLTPSQGLAQIIASGAEGPCWQP